MNYDQYECTPLFSYNESKVAIRQMKAEQARQTRAQQLTSNTNQKSQGGMVKNVMTTLVSLLTI